MNEYILQESHTLYVNTPSPTKLALLAPFSNEETDTLRNKLIF